MFATFTFVKGFCGLLCLEQPLRSLGFMKNDAPSKVLGYC